MTNLERPRVPRAYKAPRTATPIPKNKSISEVAIPGPLISIITPVYNVNSIFINECYTSILNQKYTNWEWCICDDGSNNKETLMNLNKFSSNYKVKIKFNEKNNGISYATIDAINLSHGEIIIFLDQDDELHKDALFEVVDTLKNYDVDIIYTDEALKGDKITYHYKPNFSPHYLLSSNYICHLVAVKKSLYDNIGGIRTGFDGAQDHDLILRLTHASKKIFHIPKALYYWRIHPNSYSSKNNNLSTAIQSGVKAVSEELSRRGLSGKVESSGGVSHYTQQIDIPSNITVSIIIISTKNTETTVCIDSILEITNYVNYEVIVLSKNQTELHKIYADYSKIKLIQYEEDEINFPRMINIGVREASSECIIVLHADTLINVANWIQLLIGYLQDDSVGVIGGKIIDKANNVLEFGNIVGLYDKAPVLPMFKDLNKDAPGSFRRALLIQNTSTISSTMIAFKRVIFDKVGGMDEKFNLYYFDFDFCLRIKELGFFNVITPSCTIIHNCTDLLNDLSSEQHNQMAYEDESLFISKHKHMIDNGDPYFNINLKDTSDDLSSKTQKTAISKKAKISGIVSFLVPWYDQPPVAIPSLLAQTYQDIEIIVIYDGASKIYENTLIESFKDSRIAFYNTSIRYNDWGHTPRNHGLEQISSKSKAVVFTGADNYYLPTFTEELFYPIVTNKNTIATYCNLLHNKKSWNELDAKLEFTKIDCGCFMVIPEIAKEFKYGTRVSWEDWIFIEKIIKKYGSDNIIKVPRMLYIHN